jgi:membrane protein YdbS with pleckstrin-like domain
MITGVEAPATQDGSGPGASLPKLAQLRWAWALQAALPWLILGGLIAWRFSGWWCLVVVPLSAGWGWLWSGWRFERHQARWLPGEGLVVEGGVLWRSESWVPLVRIQHLDVMQGPLDRVWRMARLSVHTAGQHDRKAVVQGLPLAQAVALREAIMAQVRGTQGAW